ncbi:hypothetical protein M9H77_31239 [Catharanthus roseus]|uniref:Uncharacterized protein n=1 Tax=Catharanthus roseus TaxID=4058 RepID=A0ACC0A0T4_CATRO|nr:hypothetical protein M9H77_31239 [Catharanthus roseus]
MQERLGTTDWQIRRLTDWHSCCRSFNPKIVQPTYLANIYVDDFRATKGVEARDFIEKWEPCGIACVHSVSAIAALGEEVESYGDGEHHLITFAKVYKPVVNLLPKVLPLETLKLPGRPKKCRRKDPDEETRTSELATRRLSRVGRIKSKCGNCGKQGHNIRKLKCHNQTWSLLMRIYALNETQSLSEVENVEVEQQAGIDTQVEVEQAGIETQVETQPLSQVENVEVEQQAGIDTQVEVEKAGIETQGKTQPLSQVENESCLAWSISMV